MLAAIASMHVSESLCRALFYLLAYVIPFFSLYASLFFFFFSVPADFCVADWRWRDGDLATKTGRGCGSPDLRVVG